MSRTTKLIIIAVIAALVVGGICLAVFGLPNFSASENSQESSSSAVESSESDWKLVDAGASGKSRVRSANIDGLEKTTLTEGEVIQLEDFLTTRFAESNLDLSKARFTITQSEKVEGDEKRFKLVYEDKAKAYTLVMDEAWTLTEGYSDEPSQPASQTQSQDAGQQQSQQQSQSGTAAQSATTTQSNTTSTQQSERSELDSSKAAANFDMNKAYALSSREKVEPIIGKTVADRLLADINDYIKPSGASISGEGNVYVTEDGKSVSDHVLRFRCLAKRGEDRLVFACTYDTETLRHVITWQE